jgi:hypothetical protein
MGKTAHADKLFGGRQRELRPLTSGVPGKQWWNVRQTDVWTPSKKYEVLFKMYRMWLIHIKSK